MSVGPITSPLAWLNGTVVPPSWTQQVQDNINGLLAGTVTILGVVIDGVGGSVVTAQPGHIVAQGGTPTGIFGTGAGSGTSPPSTLFTGSDTRGLIKLTAGTSPAPSSPVLTATFSTAYASNPIVIVVPANAAAAALTGNAQIALSAISPTGFVVSSGSTALTASTLYDWNYVCIG